MELTTDDKWTIEEELYVKKNWGLLSVREMAAHLGRTNGAINARAARLGLIPSLIQAAELSAPSQTGKEWLTSKSKRDGGP